MFVFLSCLFKTISKDPSHSGSLLSRQSTQLLENIIDGLGEFLALLDLQETQVDVIMQEICQQPDIKWELRKLDEDALWLKRNYARLDH